VERSLRDLSGVAPGEVMTDATLWDRVASSMREAPVILRVSVLPGDMAQALDDLSETATASVTLSQGMARIALDADDARLRERVERQGGVWVLERAPLDLKRTLDVWGPQPAAFEVMRRLKGEFDPQGTLAPGRFVGRL
jgi:FAD/FMN-containing dehydrogenase